MLTVETPKDLKQHIGETLGPSDWITVDQAMIDKFAEATGDHQWIHVDVERAKKEMPGGKTIAHGYLTLSLLPRLAPTLMKVEKRRRGGHPGQGRRLGHRHETAATAVSTASQRPLFMDRYPASRMALTM